MKKIQALILIVTALGIIAPSLSLSKENSPEQKDPDYLTYSSSSSTQQSQPPSTSKTIFSTIGQDYKNFYSKSSLLKLSLTVAAGGVLANTGLDSSLRSFYQDNIRSDTTDSILSSVKTIGSNSFILTYGGALLLKVMLPETKLNTTIGHWGEYSLRSVIVGAPLVITLQRVLGAKRPPQSDNIDNDSKWHPFAYDHGVSGHSFLGAIPFITAAKMSDNRFARYSLYSLSTLVGLSRINNDCHYTSQVLMGWIFAYLSVDAVMKTNKQRRVKITPIVKENGAVGMQASITFSA